MKNKIWIRMIALMLAVSLVGCGKPSSTIDTSTPQTTQSEQTEKPEETEISEIPTETESVDTTSESEVNEEEIPEETEDEFAKIKAEEERRLSEEQRNSVAMLYYLATVTQDISSAKNNRMYLEEAYSSLINNTNPENVNDLTESYMSSLLDIIEKYRMIDIKRSRLQYVYEQKQAQAIKSAIPNPVSLLSAVSSMDLKRALLSTVYMAVDSYASYKSYNAEIDSEFMQDGWELDDEEAANIHDSRKRAFMFMVETVQADDLPGKLALNETAVKDFVDNKNNKNAHSRLQFLEDEKSTYEAFGNYWLELAKCHYELGDYELCLDDIATYEELQPNIFRKDYELAQALPQAIIAATELLEAKNISEQEYIQIVGKYLDQIYKNTERNEWTVRYFVAEMYVELYARTKDVTYLDAAYSILRENINYLTKQQEAENEVYLNSVKEVSVPKGPTKEQKKADEAAAKEMEAEKKRAEDYNATLNDQRKVALPPVYEPLVINCDLLFAIAPKMKLSVNDQNRIDGILNGVFLSEPLANSYKFKKGTVDLPDTGIEFAKNEFTIPAGLVSEDSVIKVTVTEDGKTTVYDDWIVKEVSRPGKEFASFAVTYTSKNAKKQKWSENTTVQIEIRDAEHKDVVPVVLNFVASKNKKLLVLSEVVFTLVK